MPTISAVIPAYNEELAIAATVEAVVDALSSLVDDFEVIVVDDGSRDRTAAVVEALHERWPTVRMVRHDANRGYGAALATGFAAATRDFIFLTDADRQFDPREIGPLLPLLREADLVIGYRRPRADPLIRRLFGWGWNTLVNTMFGYVARDVDCAFKLFPRTILAEIHAESDGHTYSPELLIKARRLGYRIVEVRVSHFPRLAGSPKGARPRAIARAMFELFALRLQLTGERSRARAARTVD